jgi:tetratricopeptide (TPR) repeat protein
MIAVEPDCAVLYNNRGQAYLRKSDFDLALADYNEALELDPQLAAGYFNRAFAHLALGQPEAACGDLEQALALELDGESAEIARKYLGELRDGPDAEPPRDL